MSTTPSVVTLAQAKLATQHNARALWLQTQTLAVCADGNFCKRVVLLRNCHMLLFPFFLIVFMAIELAFIEAVIRVFLPLFAIMDPFISVPVFISLTRRETRDKKRLIALEAVGIAALLLFVFLIFGQGLLDFLGITIASMQIAGGILLGIMGLELVLGISFPREKDRIKKVPPAALILGTPLLTGPGVITTTILLSGQYGLIVTAFAAVLALVASWLVLRYSQFVTNLIGETGSELLSRIMGLLLVAIAVQFTLTGIGAAF